MSDNEDPQDRVLVTLKIHPAAFTAALTAAIPPGKIGWTADEHYELVKMLLPDLKDASGEAAAITPGLADILRLIYKPSEDAERQVLRQSFANAGYALDGVTENIFVMMFSAAQFSTFLEKTNRPQTASAFILKDKSKKRGAKKDTFTSLLGAAPGAETPPPVNEPVQAEAQQETEEPTVEEEVVDAADDAPKPPAAKPTPTK